MKGWRVWVVVLMLTGPIVGPPGPCSSETPWGCFAHHVWLVMVSGG